ncbi:MAG: flagellar hook capping FlgD N-terminal domain-containing protein [Bryobacteraceae bacterium]|jgi:flagellar basal-body rod modification protein FlgD
MSTSVTATSGLASAASAASTPPSTSTDPSSSLANQNVFLQLLVAQLENQDPENPSDGTQFVTQLAQFTTLQEQTQGTSDLDSILGIMQASSATPQNNTTTGTNS